MTAKAPPSFVVIIPARYNSQRFPGKVLVRIGGKTVLQHVYEKACLSQASAVYVATDDERVASEASSFQASVIMTSSHLASGTERVFAAASILGLEQNCPIVNVQGDEPLLPPENISQVAALLCDAVDMASLVVPIESDDELRSNSCVKVVSNEQEQALYFSRSIIPHSSCEHDITIWQRHLGIYAYKMSFLQRYVHWKPCIYEKVEKLEQLRALYYGATIQLAVARISPPPGIDEPQDVARIEKLL